MVSVPIVPGDFDTFTFESKLADTLVTPKYCEFLNVGETALVILAG